MKYLIIFDCVETDTDIILGSVLRVYDEVGEEVSRTVPLKRVNIIDVNPYQYLHIISRCVSSLFSGCGYKSSIEITDDYAAQLVTYPCDDSCLLDSKFMSFL